MQDVEHDVAREDQAEDRGDLGPAGEPSKRGPQHGPATEPDQQAVAVRHVLQVQVPLLVDGGVLDARVGQPDPQHLAGLGGDHQAGQGGDGVGALGGEGDGGVGSGVHGVLLLCRGGKVRLPISVGSTAVVRIGRQAVQVSALSPTAAVVALADPASADPPIRFDPRSPRRVPGEDNAGARKELPAACALPAALGLEVLTQLVEAALDGIVLCDEEMRYVYANPRAWSSWAGGWRSSSAATS